MSNKRMPSAASVAVPPGPMRQPRDLSALTHDRRSSGTAAPASATGASSATGGLLFELTAHDGGVHVMRIHRRDDGAKVYCSVLFDDERMFLEWLDADSLRFTHPLAFQQARRCFAQLMAGKDSHDTVRN